MLKSLVLLLLFSGLLPCTARAAPVPPPGFKPDLSLLRNSHGLSLFAEQTWHSQLHTWLTLLPRELVSIFQFQAQKLPEHVLEGLLISFITHLPVYLILYASLQTGDFTAIPGSVWLLGALLDRFLVSLSTYYTLLFILDPAVELPPQHRITTDSFLLNSMFSLTYHIAGKCLEIRPLPWPVQPVLKPSASPVTHSLVALHQVMTRSGYQNCQLSAPETRGNLASISFWCGSSEEVSWHGELETDCEDSQINDICQPELLQPEVLECLAEALREVPPVPVSCSVSDIPRPLGDSAQIRPLEPGLPDESSDYLVLNQEQRFLSTGVYPGFQSAEDIQEYSLLPEHFWPIASSWQAQISLWEKLADQCIRTLSLFAVNRAHQRLLLSGLRFENSPDRVPENSPSHDVRDREVVLPASRPYPDSLSLVKAAELVALKLDSPDTPYNPETLPFPKSNEGLQFRYSTPGQKALFQNAPLYSPKLMHTRGSLTPPASPRQTKPIAGQRRSSVSEELFSFRKKEARPMSVPPSLGSSRRGSLKEVIASLIQSSLWRRKGSVLSKVPTILAHQDQGMDASDFSHISELSRVRMQAVFFRPVNPENQELAPLLYPGKPLKLKPKTSTWNWSEGFVPEDPRFSKMAGADQETEDTRQLIQELYRKDSNTFQPQQLRLTEKRVQKLMEKAITVPVKKDDRLEAVFEYNGITAHQIAMPSEHRGYWDISYQDGSPFMLVAHPEHGPYIADYDLLMEASPFSHHVYLSAPPGYLVVLEQPLDQYSALPATQKTVTGQEAHKQSVGTDVYDDPLTRKKIRRTVLRQKTYYQSQHFKPVDLGQYDRLSLPLVSDQLVLDYLRPRIMGLARRLETASQEQLQVLLSKASRSNYLAVKQLLVSALVQFYHPDSSNSEQVITELSGASPEELPKLWRNHFPVSGLPESKALYQKTASGEALAVHHCKSYLIILQDLHLYLAGMDRELGNLTPRMLQLIQQINHRLDRGEGRDMVCHGSDSANPFSKLESICPVTVMLPFAMSSHTRTGLLTQQQPVTDLIRILKSHGFHIHINPLWKLDRSVRSSRFEWALRCLKIHFGEQVITTSHHFYSESDPVQPEIQLPEHWQ